MVPGASSLASTSCPEVIMKLSELNFSGQVRSMSWIVRVPANGISNWVCSGISLLMNPDCENTSVDPAGSTGMGSARLIAGAASASTTSSSTTHLFRPRSSPLAVRIIPPRRLRFHGCNAWRFPVVTCWHVATVVPIDVFLVEVMTQRLREFHALAFALAEGAQPEQRVVLL